MLAHEIVKLFLDRHCPLKSLPQVEWITAKAMLELLLPLAQDFVGVRPLAEHARLSEAYEGAADQTIRRMAVLGTFSPVKEAEAGTQRVLLDRFDWGMTVLAEHGNSEKDLKIALPLGVNLNISQFAILLAVLAEYGRNSPSEWRCAAGSKVWPEFPATTRPRRQ
ncbi:hypothetical protein [Labrys sp. 22185]|uniref:hypothetical protein n=1 Tax=Labrys sp. 22185 TaxID=3453888 RepID=UPI003F8264E9